MWPSMKFTPILWRKNSTNLKSNKFSTKRNQTQSTSLKSLNSSGSRLLRKNSGQNYKRLTTEFPARISKIMRLSCIPSSLISKELRFSWSKWGSCKPNKAMSKRIKLMTSMSLWRSTKTKRWLPGICRQYFLSWVEIEMKKMSAKMTFPIENGWRQVFMNKRLGSFTSEKESMLQFKTILSFWNSTGFSRKNMWVASLTKRCLKKRHSPQNCLKKVSN